MPIVNYVEHDGVSHQVEIPVGHNLMEGAVRNSVPGIEGDCGGACACATCHIYISSDWAAFIGTPSSDEVEMLECANEVTGESRLSCQIVMSGALDGLIVRLPQSQR